MSAQVTIADVDAMAKALRPLRALVAQAEQDRKEVVELRRALEIATGAIGGRVSDDQVLSALRRLRQGVSFDDLRTALGVNRSPLRQSLDRLRERGAVRLVGLTRRAVYVAVQHGDR